MIEKIKRRDVYSICLIIFLIFFWVSVISVEAVDGQVSTTSGITFVKGNELPITKSEESVSPPKTIVDSGKKLLPKTGEALNNTLLYGVIVISLGFFYWIVLKRRRKNEK